MERDERDVNPLTRNRGLDTLRSGCQENRADSSVGRALPLQGRGHRFNPCSAYHVKVWYAEAGSVFAVWRVCSYTQELIGDQRLRLVVLLFCHR
ncbi:hypothetical protein COMA2_10396 [Candidatus Nitrospira nitrificans]|uniref:Uncharacterized protein n=1 Tax=Candidatus Nitrospira nitrificans TaxID=1742973 RepID=A0A0S4L2P3_9BACT|nr:hypothetical protein COMA2_10396 [Candidatus Nitrospira nitrificans]